VRVFVTGGAGFVMGAVVRRLRERGDGVVALVRSRARARLLEAAGCELVEGDLLGLSPEMLRGCDALIHGAAIYEIGVSRERRAQMEATNVEGTQRVLAVARDAGIRRVVYVSTIAAFGNTGGKIVIEGTRPTEPPTSAYEDTKRRAHEVALDAARAGLPIVIVQPGQVYGPDDHSEIGGALRSLAEGRLRYRALGGLGLNFVHVDDLADGIVRALDRGRVSECYVLGGEIATLDDAYRAVALAAGRPLPRLVIPNTLLRAAARLVPRLRETVASADGVTFWASDAKAREELGTRPRNLRDGMRDTFARAPR
jgi:nucleoside-diphosphate-sugar epimerase